MLSMVLRLLSFTKKTDRPSVSYTFNCYTVLNFKEWKELDDVIYQWPNPVMHILYRCCWTTTRRCRRSSCCSPRGRTGSPSAAWRRWPSRFQSLRFVTQRNVRSIETVATQWPGADMRGVQGPNGTSKNSEPALTFLGPLGRVADPIKIL